MVVSLDKLPKFLKLRKFDKKTIGISIGLIFFERSGRMQIQYLFYIMVFFSCKKEPADFKSHYFLLSCQRIFNPSTSWQEK